MTTFLIQEPETITTEASTEIAAPSAERLRYRGTPELSKLYAILLALQLSCSQIEVILSTLAEEFRSTASTGPETRRELIMKLASLQTVLLRKASAGTA